MTRPRLPAMLLVTLAAFAARVWSLGNASLSFDEAWDVTRAADTLPAMLDTLAQGGLHPPLHYLLLHAWILVAGQREFAVRFVSLVPGVLLVPLAFATAREVYSSQPAQEAAALAVGVPAALLVALSPYLLYTSQEARMYSLAACLSLAAVLTLLRATRGLASGAAGSARPWLGHAVAVTGLLYTQYLALFLASALGLYAVLSGPRVLARWLGALFLAAVLWLPWAGVALQQLQRLSQNPDYPLADLSVPGVAAHILAAFLGLPSLRLAPFASALAGVASLLVLGWRQRHSPVAARAEMLVVAAAALPILLTAVAASIAPKFAPRYAIVAAPLVFIALPMLLFSLLWHRVAWRVVYAAILLVAVTFAAPRAWSAAHFPWEPQEDARRLGAYLTDRAAADHAIVLVENAPDAFDYYYRGPAPRYGVHVEFNFDEAAARLNDVLARRPERVWLALWHHEFADPSAFVITELVRRSEEPPAVRRQFPGYTLMRFDLRDWSPVVAAPPPQLRLDANFGDRLTLVGADRLDNGPDVPRWILYWQARQPLDHDYSVAVQLRDAAGQVRLTHDQPPSTPYLATAAFPVGVTLRGLTEVRLPDDFPAGVYEAVVLVWDVREQRNLAHLSPDGTPRGVAVSLGPVEVRR